MRRDARIGLAPNSLLIPCSAKKFPALAKKFPALAKNSLLCLRREFIRKHLNQRMFSRRMFAKEG